MAKKKWYAVAKGKTRKIFTQWFGPDGAKSAVDGFKGAVYKSFYDYQDALDFMNNVSDTKKEKKSFSGDEPEINNDHVTVFTDGGCINNPGPGGYGAVIIYDGEIKELSGGKRHTTNNRMEMLACIKAFEFLKNEKRKIILHTDSAYIVNAVNKGWIYSWEKNNWVKSDKNNVLNSDLWKEIKYYYKKLNIEFRWVKGHAGIKYNERCDELANSQARSASTEIDQWFEEYEKQTRD